MIIWRMSDACYITKATNTFRISNTYNFSTTSMVAKSSLNVTLYVHCLSCKDLTITGTLHTDLRTFMIVSRWILLRTKNVSEKKV